MEKKKICIAASWGHGEYQDGIQDIGAARRINGKVTDTELRITQASVKYIVSQLKEVKGRTWLVDNLDAGTEGRHLDEQNRRIDKLRKKYRTVAFDYHVNAGGGKGVEIYIGAGNDFSREIAENMMKEMQKAGIPLHGGSVSAAIHTDNTLQFLKGDGPRFLFECGYIDSSDYKRFDTSGELKKMNDIFIKVLVNYCRKYD